MCVPPVLHLYAGCTYYHKVALARYLLSLPRLDTDRVRARILFTRHRFSGLVGQKDLRDQPAVILSKPSSHSMKTIHLIHDLYRSKTIWIVDVEFHQPRGYLPVPFCLAFTDAKTDEIILRTTVNYESTTLTELEERFKSNSFNRNIQDWASAQFLKTRWHNLPHIHGMSLLEIGKFLKGAGFAPSRQLRSLATSNGRECLQPFNLGCTVMQCSNLISGKLGFVYKAIFGKDNMCWHLPEYDCLGMAKILRWFVDRISNW
jgi:hypothetical protein